METLNNYSDNLPGCKNNFHETVDPYCPASSPKCDASSHTCTADSGSVLLESISVTTASCEGCDHNQEGDKRRKKRSLHYEGVYMVLTGLQDYIKCETNTLDHADIIDFSLDGLIGKFSTEEDDKVADGWGGCYASALKGEVNGAVVRWEGTGTWTVDKICFDWSDPDVNVWVCTGDGTSLTAGQEMTLTCSKSDDFECP